MDPQAVIDHFGSITKAAEALGVKYQAVHNWRQAGKVPPVRQWQIQAITAGRFQAEELQKVEAPAQKSSGVGS